MDIANFKLFLCYFFEMYEYIYTSPYLNLNVFALSSSSFKLLKCLLLVKQL